MAVQQVNRPTLSPNQGVGMLASLLQSSSSPYAKGAGYAIAAGQASQNAQAGNTTPSAQPVESSSSFNNGAMGRRKELMNTDHVTEFKNALAVIDSSDWDEERKKQLRAPIEQAMYKGGYA
jgi:hypothetical protein